MFEGLVAATAGATGAAAVNAYARLENASCARRLAAMVAMLDAAYAADGSAERDQWCLDNWGAVTAHIGAVRRQACWAVSGVLLVALALRDRYPRVQGLFTEGLIDYPMVRLFVQRASAIIDPQTWAALDDKVAEMLVGGEPMSQHTAQKAIDGLIWELDPCAVHRSQTRARNRHVDVLVDDETGVAQLAGNLLATAGHALNARLDAFAATVCPHDPRTKDQRRADAVLPLSNGADRLGCQCNREDCLAALRPPSTGVIIHLVAHDDTITGPTQPAETTTPSPDPAAPAPVEECAGLDGPQPPILTTPLRELTHADVANHLTPIPRQLSTIAPAIIVGGGVLPGAIARRAAHGATRSVIVHPGQAPPEPRYRPSAKLAEFIRCRDLTCRYPGCKAPATGCDVDHTIPWPYGPTAASNLKCLCRSHHLLKTFWSGHRGWRDQQLPDGTIIWTDPDGGTHTTEPGSRQLFPSLCTPTAPVVPKGTPPPGHTAGLTMPRRRHTRTQDRQHRILEERELNRLAIEEDHLAALDDIADAEITAPDCIPPF